jgi:hypothetical protein
MDPRAIQRRRNLDLELIRRMFGPQAPDPRFRRVQRTWVQTPRGMLIQLRNYPLPQNCQQRSSRLFILQQADLYHPNHDAQGLVRFYQDQWVDPGIQIRDPRSRSWGGLPRLMGRGDPEDWGAYYCLHGLPVGPEKNILHHLRAIELEIGKSDPNVY